MSVMGQVGDIVLCDLSQYILIDNGLKGGLSMDVKFLTHEGVFRFTYRVDGKLAWASPITPFNGSQTRLPAVALAAR